MNNPDAKILLPKKFMRAIQIPVRWGDMDALGHVNNTIYFRYLETARIEWFDSLGATSDPQGVGPLLVAASCNFRVAVVYPETIEVRTYTRTPGRSSIPIYQEIWSATKPNLLYADGDSTIAWVDYGKAKSVPLPHDVRTLATPT